MTTTSTIATISTIAPTATISTLAAISTIGPIGAAVGGDELQLVDVLSVAALGEMVASKTTVFIITFRGGRLLGPNGVILTVQIYET